jgi:FkbM family methyltransferase
MSAPGKAAPDIITNKKYIRLCDVAFKTRSRNDLKLPLRRNAIVCAGGERAILNEFFKLDIRTPFTLVTIENDEATPQDVTWLKHKYLTRWYSWNSNHPEVHPIPIGLNEDSQLQPMVRAKRAASKTMKLLVNFRQDRPERKSLHNRLKSLDWVHVEPYSKKWQSQAKLTTHYESISKYTWTLCPRGAGQDTHRLWEALYLGSIPVVLKSNLSPLYAGLPVIQLESWDQLSLETLKTLSKSLPTSRRNANFGYWANIIRGAHTKKKKKILAYSLYGSDRRYTDGALANSKLYHEIYPDWDMRVYHDKTVPESIINELRNNGVDLVDMTGSPLNKMSWRFLPASDSEVDRFCARDIDSRLSNREKAAVDAWIESGKKFHVMRDHPSHSKYAMSGGMWCGTHDAAPDMDKLLQKRHMTQSYLQDMDFLNNVIWPIAKDHILQHDSFSCDKFGGGSPFPTRRIGWEHVGSVFINGKMRKGDVDILKKAGVVEKCVMSQVPEKNPTSSLEISVSGAESDHAVTNQLLECMQPTDVENIDLRKGVSGSTEELLLKQIKPHIDLANGISVDIGGNQGVFSELIATVFGKPPMYIFDVIPRFVADLRSKFPESTVEHLAVSDGSVETVDIKGASTWKSDFNTGASILTRGPSYDAVLATVKTTTLDTFFTARSGDKTDIAFLKVDTEGADGRVLRGAEKLLRAKKINCIFWENNKMQNEIGDSLYKNVQFLNSVGYSSFVVAHDTLFPISACRKDTGVFDLNRPTGNILSVVAGSPLLSALLKVHEFKKLAEVPSTFKPSAKHPYPVTKLNWGTCTTHFGKPSLFDAAKKTWRVVISSDTNTNYLAFAPSVVAHWKRRGIEVSLGLVVTKADSKAKVDGLVRALKEATEMDIRVLPIEGKIGLPTGHAAKLARAFMATQFDDDDVVTIMDIDYYLLWFEQWSAHLKCTPEDGLLALGYNRYGGTVDEGKYPMYLGTAKSSVFSKFLNPDREASFETWIQRFKDIHVFDSKESPFSHWGQFSDESLFRALLSRSPLPTVWVNTPTSWKRIDRAHSHPVSNSELSIAADVFPNRPLDVCKTYNERLRPVHRFLGIEDPNREKNFINALIELNVQNRDWGQGRFKKTSTLENCV